MTGVYYSEQRAEISYEAAWVRIFKKSSERRNFSLFADKYLEI
jgi:hypothetical protein